MMKIYVESLILENNEKMYNLKEVLSYDELYELRKKHTNNYVVVKIDNKLYTPITHIKGGTNFEGKRSICENCSKFSHCPKVIDHEFINGRFTTGKYIDLMRLEKYPFIKLGVETYGRFFVWKCTSYEKENLHNEDKKQQRLEELYPYLKELKLKREQEEEKENLKNKFHETIRKIS